MEKEVKYAMCLIPETDGGFVALSPDFPGAITEGDNLDEAIYMAADALKCMIEGNLEIDQALPAPCTLKNAAAVVACRWQQDLEEKIDPRKIRSILFDVSLDPLTVGPASSEDKAA